MMAEAAMDACRNSRRVIIVVSLVSGKAPPVAQTRQGGTHLLCIVTVRAAVARGGWPARPVPDGPTGFTC
jgi:hypothetical protein